MQLHHSHKLMQPEGHLVGLKSIWEVWLYMYAHGRGRLFAASFRRWQAFGSGPHCGPHADAFAGPTQTRRA